MTSSRLPLFTTAVLFIGLLHAWAATVAWIRRGASVRHHEAAEVMGIGLWAMLPYLVLLAAQVMWPRERKDRTVLGVAGTLVGGSGIVLYLARAADYGLHGPNFFEGLELLIWPLYQLVAALVSLGVMWALTRKTKARLAVPAPDTRQS